MVTVISRTSRFFSNDSFGLVLIRLGLGLLFFTHGWMKLGQMPMIVGMFQHFGFGPLSVATAYFIAWLEVIGGLALILGIATRLFAFLFGIEMLVATLLVGFAHGLGLEPILSLISFGLAWVGSGRYSIYAMDHINRRGEVTEHVERVVAE